VKEPVNSAKAKQIIREIATGLIDHQHPGSFNQAIMEYGARTCIPGIPMCDSCCFEQSCFAYSHNSVGLLPVKNKKVRQRTRYFNYLVITSDNENAWIMRKRVAQDIWKGLYDFPLIETAKLLSLKSLKATRDWSLIEKMNPGPLIRCSGQFRHILTHQVIVARFFRISVSKVNVVPEGCIQVRDLTKIPVPRLIEKYLQNLV
jgi:A/G-specific adenine glycosylase